MLDEKLLTYRKTQLILESESVNRKVLDLLFRIDSLKEEMNVLIEKLKELKSLESVLD